jgi:hypothetical protein
MMLFKSLSVYAQETINITPQGTIGDTVKNITVGGIVSTAITWILIIAAIIFFFMLLIGGISWLTSGGDEQKVAGAKGQITNALIGLAIVLAGWAIVTLVGSFFGIEFGSFTLPSVGGTNLPVKTK